MKRKGYGILLCLVLILVLSACSGKKADRIAGWREDSPEMASIVSYVSAVTDEKSEDYVPPECRIAVFDMDGTLYGERFPTYFDESLLLHRLLHDEAYEAAPEDRAWARSAEEALLKGEPEPDSPRSSAQMAAEAFQGFALEDYQAYVRAFMDEPAAGFEGMTYGEGFYEPMVSLVEYLDGHGFTIFISSGAERTLARVLIADRLGEWIPPDRVIGSTFTLTASGQGDSEGRKYTFGPDDRVLLEGDLAQKNQRMNKVVTIVDEIGQPPLLVFGNSSGDVSMAQYALQHGGRAYMLLCDDTDRDYGDPEEAADFEKTCRDLGFETVSMRDAFETIYQEGASKTSLSGR